MARTAAEPGIQVARLTRDHRSTLTATMVTLALIEGWLEEACPHASVVIDGLDDERTVRLLPALAEVKRRWTALDLGRLLGLDRDDDLGHHHGGTHA